MREELQRLQQAQAEVARLRTALLATNQALKVQVAGLQEALRNVREQIG